MSTPLQAIETNYRGYRFRSRTEARWAVFLDAAGIAWQYEAEGYKVNGQYYLPDFWLPQEKAFLEVKPTKEAAEQSAPLMRALIAASGCPGYFAVGLPAPENREHALFRCFDHALNRAFVTQCIFCHRLYLHTNKQCDCSGAVKVLHAPHCKPLRFWHALGEAQRARFEHGETGQPAPYVPPPLPPKTRIYLAGAIFRGQSYPSDWSLDDETEVETETWRSEIFSCETIELQEYNAITSGRFIYGGPSIFHDHGIARESLARDCLQEVATCDALFAWIDRDDTIGTLVEIGAAYAQRKPLFVAFADEQLSEHFYFGKQIATIAVIAADAVSAWKLFARWQSKRYYQT
jgi:nucleoside 2-deoxyribosyltransferase